VDANERIEKHRRGAMKLKARRSVTSANDAYNRGYVNSASAQAAPSHQTAGLS